MLWLVSLQNVGLGRQACPTTWATSSAPSTEQRLEAGAQRSEGRREGDVLRAVPFCSFLRRQAQVAAIAEAPLTPEEQAQQCAGFVGSRGGPRSTPLTAEPLA